MKRIVLTIICTLLAFTLSAKKQVVQTEHFKIVFDDESSLYAQIVYENVEEMYSSLVSFFNEDPKLNIPIYIKRGEYLYNAYSSIYPSSHIVLYDTVAPISLFSNTENPYLLTLYHELTHAFVHSIKGGYAKALELLFGDIFNPSYFTVYLDFITEGIAVYLESRGGEGRLNSSTALIALKQGIIDYPDKSYLDIAGSQSDRNLSYIYGGAFLEYLAKTYSEEKVGEFITRLSKSLTMPTIQMAFKETFNCSITTAFKEFIDSVTLPSNLFTPEIFISENLSNLVYKNSKLYALSKTKGSLVYIKDNQAIRLFDHSSYDDNLSISDSGLFMCVNKQDNKSSIIVYNEHGDKIVSYDGYLSGCFSKLGSNEVVVLYKGSSITTILDVYDLDGSFIKRYTLGDFLTAGSFTSLDNNMIVFVLNKSGKCCFATLVLDNEEINIYESDKSIDILSLSQVDNKIFFSYVDQNRKESLARYGEAEFVDNEIIIKLSSTNIDGSVYHPIRLNDDIYFLNIKSNIGNLCIINVDSISFDDEIRLQQKEYLPKERVVKLDSKDYKLSLMRGITLPLSLDGDFPGITWLTSDITSMHDLLLSFGYKGDNNYYISSAYTYNSFVTLSGSASFSDKIESYLLSLGVEKEFSLSHKGEKLKLTETLSYSSKFTNLFTISYENKRKKNSFSHAYLGFNVMGELTNNYSSISLSLFHPGLINHKRGVFDFTLPSETSFRYYIQERELEASNRVYLLTYDYNRAISFMYLFVSSINCYLDNNFLYDLKSNRFSYEGLELTLSASLSPIVGSLSKVKIESGVRVSYRDTLCTSFLLTIAK